MKNPAGEIRIASLGKNSKLCEKQVASVKILGSKEKLKWNQLADALTVNKPSKLPDWQVGSFQHLSNSEIPNHTSTLRQAQDKFLH